MPASVIPQSGGRFEHPVGLEVVAKIPLALWLILLAALAMRIGWAATRPVDPAAIEQLPDQREYLEVARSLLHGEGLSLTDPRFGQRVYAYRTPGYPLFLAATGAKVRIARIAQAILDTSTVFAVFLLARRWLPPAACLFAAFLVASNPFLVYFSGLLLTETLFTALLAWGMFFITSRRIVPALFGAILLAGSILVRPGALPLPVILGVLASLAVNRQTQPPYHRRWWALPAGTSMLLLTILVLLPWAIRNHRVVGKWVWTSTNSGITRYDGFNPDATGASDQSFVAAMPQLKAMSEIERDEYFAREADHFIRARPMDALKLAGKKVLRTWSPRPLSREFSRREYVLIALAYSVPFFTLFLLGWVTSPMPATAKLFLAAPAVYLTVAAAISVGSLRYRIPAEVPMAIVAAAGVARFRRPAGPVLDPAAAADD
jgi:4-amino-4-deoxy-L-arabinose transferase-like glycosyltransferase